MFSLQAAVKKHKHVPFMARSAAKVCQCLNPLMTELYLKFEKKSAEESSAKWPFHAFQAPSDDEGLKEEEISVTTEGGKVEEDKADEVFHFIVHVFRSSLNV